MTRKLMPMNKALDPRDDIDELYIQKKKKEEDTPAWKIAWIHQYEDSETTWKRGKFYFPLILMLSLLLLVAVISFTNYSNQQQQG